MSQPPVVLIHGVGSSSEHNWRQPGWVDLLSELGRSVLTVDLPGHGAAEGRVAPDRDAAELIVERAAAHGSVDAVGFSAGGYALLTAASREPALFRRIAVLGVADSGLGRVSAEGIAAAVLSDAEPSDAMALLFHRLVRTAGNDPAAVAGFLRSRQARAGLGELAAITAATLVVEGTKDPGGPAEALAAAIPGARRLEVRGADHFAIPSDFRCMDAVLSFLAQ
jgi:pimeloyl-ACP methyl ester carboxylesterase